MKKKIGYVYIFNEKKDRIRQYLLMKKLSVKTYSILSGYFVPGNEIVHK